MPNHRGCLAACLRSPNRLLRQILGSLRFSTLRSTGLEGCDLSGARRARSATSGHLTNYD